MFRALVRYFWGDSKPALESQLQSAFDLLVDEASKLSTEEEKEEDIADYTCSTKHGVITKRNNCRYEIDHQYIYHSSELNLNVGTKIFYILFKDGNNFKVTNVKVFMEEDWECNNPDVEAGWCHRKIIQQIDRREGRILLTSPNNIKVNLNMISCNFVPIEGDWIELDVKCAIDENISDLSGTILEIIDVHPLRSKIIEGNIRFFNENTFIGTINKDIYFTREALTGGYIPRKNDKVVCEIIESTQNECTWRALKILLANDLSINRLSVFNEMPKSLNYVNDIDGVMVTKDIYVNLNNFNEAVHFPIQIKNELSQNLELKEIKFDANTAHIQLVDKKLALPIPIKSEQNIELTFSISTKSVGSTKEEVIFIFDAFNIGRTVFINMKNSKQYDTQTRFKKNNYSNSRSNHSSNRIRGEMPAQGPRFVSNRISEYRIPEDLKKILMKLGESSLNIQNDLIKLRPVLLETLTMQNYESKFHTLLFIDEINQIMSMRKYDKDLACFIKNGEFLMLEIENLAEKRPTIIIGDNVIATHPLENSASYMGCVHKVTGTHLYLKFTTMFHDSYKGEDYAIRVELSRMPMRKLHHAVRFATKNLGKEILFPTYITKKNPQVKFTYKRYFDTLSNCSSNTTFKTASTSSNVSNTIVRTSPALSNISSNTTVRTPSVLSNNSSNTTVKAPLTLSNNSSTTVKAASETSLKSPMGRREIENRMKMIRNKQLNGDKQSASEFKLEWFNTSLNYYQKEAVRNILLGEAKPLPYVIFGPPGTGKTITVIETVLQLLRMLPYSRILIATPSNSAADLIATRLIDSGSLKPGDLVRFVSYKSILEDSIPLKLIPYTATGSIAKEGSVAGENVVMKNGLTLGCTSSVLGRHRVTVGTCGSFGTFHNMGMKVGQFTHVIIDEAGQCTEPESMIPLSLINANEGQIILAGDPMQLGPVVLSTEAQEFGLDESFLDRLAMRSLYQRDLKGFPETGGYNPMLITRLVYNYRSLPSLLKLPNKMFYYSELQATISDTDSKEAIFLKNLYEILPTRTNAQPTLVFHGIDGCNCQSEDSPSWFNPDEASQVFYYINQLYSLNVTAADIGVISPYIKQVKLVRELLREAEFEIPKIGTVEEFQGQEFNVIILTTVRSNSDLVSSDLKHSLGFISSPRRLNVALTRAKCLTIVIGNPYLLTNDPYWRNVLTFCYNQGTYIGCDIDLINK